MATKNSFFATINSVILDAYSKDVARNENICFYRI